ncbi:unnamed protein product [Durusdinium trenchii]|uniref:Nucleotide-diphospho-sugar transferase domain-containing protein n=1 Tax=Durusdinium trenchii TaxID=1381693 RepID=A0ABP0IAN7_9DINO
MGCALSGLAALSGVTSARGSLLFPDYVTQLAAQEHCLPDIQEPQPIRAGSDLEALLPQLADASGLIVFSVFVDTKDHKESKRFELLLQQWMCRVRSHLGSSFLAFVDSEKLRQQFERPNQTPAPTPVLVTPPGRHRNFGVAAYFSKEWIKEAFQGSGEGEKHDSNYWRWAAMESILRLGYSALYVDTDIMWLEDPRPGLATLPSADFYGSCDSYDAGTGAIRWHQNGSLDMERMRKEAAKHDDESVCCQGMLVPVNAGIVLMRPSKAAWAAVMRFRARVISGPCWGQAAMQWSLFELCGSSLQCEVLDPLRFASAGPLLMELRRTQQASYQPSLIHLDLGAKRKANKFFEGFFDIPKECSEPPTETRSDL